jgi:hypothetical protein
MAKLAISQASEAKPFATRRVELGRSAEIAIGIAFVLMCAAGVITVLLPEGAAEAETEKTPTASDTTSTPTH